MVKHAHTRPSFKKGNINHGQTCSYTTVIYTRQQQPRSNMLIHTCLFILGNSNHGQTCSYTNVIYTRQHQPWSSMLILDCNLHKVTATTVKHAHTQLSFTQGNSNRGQKCSYTTVIYTRKQQPLLNMLIHDCHLH